MLRWREENCIQETGHFALPLHYSVEGGKKKEIVFLLNCVKLVILDPEV